ncbi:MAG TPA: hypothetical protein VM511_02830, partial [Luteolibacter sp.]|nr:hypothetical protein [Luteolibacter sp.]
SKALAEAEKAHKQSVEIAQAAKAGADQAQKGLEALKQSRLQRRNELNGLLEQKKGIQADVDAKRAALAAQPENQRDPAPLSAAEQKNREVGDQITKLQQWLDSPQNQETELARNFENAGKTAGVAQARIKPSEDALPPLRKAIEEADKSAKEALASIEKIKNEFPQIKAAEKHWSAAAINANAIKASRDAEQSALESEGELDGFTEAIKALEPRFTALAEKRAQRASLSAKLSATDLSNDFRDEITATVDAIGAVIDREAADLRKLQDAALAARSSVEEKLPVAHQALAQATQLKQAYEKARQ